MSVRSFALIYGLLFAVTGIAGFIPGLVTPHDAVEHQLAVEQGAGDLLGLFPTNVLHNIVHIAFGVWGIVVYRSASGAIGYARAVAIVYAVFMVMGLMPGLDTMMGFVPLHGNDVWLHAALAAAAAYFGFVRHAELDHVNRPAPRGM
jgi:hypothetical protein